jgi:DNA polymerase III sliding clamp (beta) subunit (PCNA family)
MSKINLPIAELKPALAGLGKIIAKRTTLPVLSYIRMDRTKDGWIALTGTDLDAFITVRLEEPAAGEPASILVPYDDLAKTAKGCSSSETIMVEQSGKAAIVLHYPVGQQTAQITLESPGVEEFPPIPRIKGEPVSLNAEIRTSLLEAMECASTDQTRQILQGAYLDVSDRKCHQIVGTDGRHLYGSNSITLPLKESVIIPTNKFLAWKEFNADGELQLRLEPEKGNAKGYVQISSRRWRFIHPQVEGQYPNWRQVIPNKDQFKTTVEFEPAATKDLMQTVSRMPNYDSVNHTIGVKVEGRKVKFTARSDGKPLEIEIAEATAKGKDAVFHLNRNYLIKALAFKLCHLQVVDEMTAIRFHDNAGRQMIVMPVRGDGAPVTTPARAPAPAPSTKPQEEPHGDSSSAPVNSETQNERSTTMPRTSTNGHTNGHQQEESQPVSIDTALEQIETVKGSYRDAIRGLNTLADTLKQVQRGQKSAEKEVQSVRSTLEKLQTLKI